MSVIKYLFRRLLIMIPVLFGVLLITFILAKMMPGDPVQAHLPQVYTPEQYQEMLHRLGLDRPIWEQFFTYILNIFTGNWGVSLSINKGQAVWDLIWERFPRTLDITLFSMIIASFLGLKTGVISAVHRNKSRDTIVRGFALIGVSIPVFWLGLMLQLALAYRVPLFPATGYLNQNYIDPEFKTGFLIIDALITGEWYLISDYLYHLALPVFCLSFITLASITRQTRSSMLEVLQQDYVRTARAKGCKEKDVINKHTKKNALIPTITVIGLNVGGLLGGAILTETTFNLHGVGELLISAIVDRDYYVINAIVFMTTLLFIVINIFVDLIYAYIDPRIKY